MLKLANMNTTKPNKSTFDPKQRVESAAIYWSSREIYICSFYLKEGPA